MVDAEKKYLHDLIASDRRNPTVNAYGPLYGSPEYSTDNMPILDPKTNKVTFFKMPVARSGDAGIARAGPCRDASSRCSRRPIGARRSSGTRAPTTTTPCSTSEGRVWLAATRARPGQPGVLQEGLGPSVGQGVPARAARARQVAMLDPKTMKYTFVDTCFGTHHPQFGYDADNTLWLSRHRAGGGLGEHQGVRRDRRRGQGAGLVAVRARHQRQRQARRVRRAEPAGRCGEGQAHRRRAPDRTR